MIESSNPEIDVDELMQRVRKEAAKLRASDENGRHLPMRAAAPVAILPALGDLQAPPPLGSSGPLELKKERLDGLLKQAREMTEVARGIPKFLRGLFRRQGGYNRNLLDAVAALTKLNVQLNKRVQELQSAAQQHHDWIRILIERRQADADWMKTAAPTITSFAGWQERAAHVEGKLEVIAASAQESAQQLGVLEAGMDDLRAGAAEARQVRTLLDAHTSRVEELRNRAERSEEHLRNLQSQADASGEHLRNLQRTAEQVLVIVEQNQRAAEHLRNLQTQVDRQTDFLQGFREQAERQAEHLRNLQTQADTSSEHLRHLQDEWERAGEQLRDLRPLLPTTARIQGEIPRLESEIARLESEIARLGEVHRVLDRLEQRQTSDAIFLKGQVAQHAAVLQQSISGARPKKGAKAATNTEPPQMPAPTDLDAFYVSFENRFRGTRDDIKERVRFYLPLLKAAKAGTAARPVLDVGCGRGEWLELLGENKLQASGVDLNSAMVAECAERRLDVTQADVIAHLHSLGNNTLGCVSGFHIIEHLPFETLLELFLQTRRVLKPGGIAIFESPNCKNVMVGACYFNVDPTHRNPVFPETAQFIMETQGFERVELEYLSPAARPFTTGDHDAEMLNDLLFGPQDFAVIGRKPVAR